jgi:HEPN domain-containing protein
MNRTQNTYLKKATHDLHEAVQELNKPEEDVVSYAICKFSQSAINNYLRGFLLEKGITTGESETLEELYQKCLSLDEKFKHLDLHFIDCRAGELHNDQYCSEVEIVSKCHSAADKLDSILRSMNIV